MKAAPSPFSKRLRGAASAAVLASAVLAAACNPGGSEPLAVAKVHSVSFATHTALDTSCQRLTITPTVAADTGAITAVIWSSSDSTIVQPDSIGRLFGLAPGSALIKATAFLDQSKFDTVRVTVVDPAGPFVSVSTIQQAATGAPANLAALHDSVDVVLNVLHSGCRKVTSPKWVRADVTFAGAQTLTKSFNYPTGIAGTVLVRVNTGKADSTKTTNTLANGSYSVTAAVTRSDSVVSRAPNAIQVTVANP